MGVWGVVICVLSVVRVVVGVPLWVVCVFRRVDLVHPVAILNAMFCVICSLLMFVSDASGDHMMVNRALIPGGRRFRYNLHSSL